MSGTSARRPTRTPAASMVAVGVAAALVAVSAGAGWWLTGRGVNLHLGSTYPVSGRYDLHLSGWLLGPLLLAAAVWYAGPRLAARLRWGAVLAAGYLTAVGWAVALARVGGPYAIGAPLTTRWEYLAEVGRIDAMGVTAYLATFTDFIVGGPEGPGWANHVAGHPPLLTLPFVLLHRAGLGGPGWAAALCIAMGAAAVPAVLATVRLLAGEELARVAAPYVAAAPVALWVATSADAIVAGVAAVGVAVVAHAAVRAGATTPWVSPRRSATIVVELCRSWQVIGVLGGLVLGGVLMLSYGMVLLAPIVLAVVVALAGWRRAVPLLAVVGLAALAVLAGFAAVGFWWPEGLAETAHRVRIGEGWSQRPAAYFWFGNPAALAVAVGPAVVAALPLLRLSRPAALNRSAGLDRWEGRDGPGGMDQPMGWRGALRLGGLDWLAGRDRLAVPALAALVAVALAMASQLSKGEVERIWLPFAVWLLPLAALLPRPGGDGESIARVGAARSSPTIRRAGGKGGSWLAAHLGWPVVIATFTTLTW